MKKLSGKMIALIVVAAIVFIGIMWGVRTNNRMIAAEEGVSAAWAQVENVYQRRLRLRKQVNASMCPHKDLFLLLLSK